MQRGHGNPSASPGSPNVPPVSKWRLPPPCRHQLHRDADLASRGSPRLRRDRRLPALGASIAVRHLDPRRPLLWLAGTGALVSARRGVAHTLAGGASSFGRATHVNPIVRRALNPLRVAILALAGTTLLLLDRPSLASLIVILAITLLLLLVVQVLATPADATGTNVSSSSPNSSTEQP